MASQESPRPPCSSRARSAHLEDPLRVDAGLYRSRASKRANGVRAATATTKTREFQPGDTVTFKDRDGWSVTGVAVRINQRTATFGTGDGGSWRVPVHMLRHVLDI